MSASITLTIDEFFAHIETLPQVDILPLLQQYDAQASPYEAGKLVEALSSRLELSCQTGDLAYVSCILEHWKALTCTDAPDDDLLFQLLVSAAQNGHHDLVRCLLSHGAKVTPIIPSLVIASADPEIDIRDVVRVIIEVGAWSINETSADCRPALQYAVKRPELLSALLEWGADPNAVGHDGLTPHDAAAGRSTTRVFDHLLAAGAMLTNAYPLHQAVASSSSDALPMIKHLIALGVDINARLFEHHPERAKLRQDAEDFGTPLHCAARSGSKGRVVFLLEHSADAGKRSSRGKSALDWAQRARRPRVHAEVLGWLAEVERGVDHGDSDDKE